MDVVNAIPSSVISLFLRGQRDVLKLILNIRDETPRQVAKRLRMGDELCRESRITHMSSELTVRVRDIYKRCKSTKGDTALMLALDMGLMDMVWGFIECAKQTNTNLHTGQAGDVKYVQEFFWIANKSNLTAFNIAIEKDYVEVARLLLNYAPRGCLMPQWKQRGNAILHLLDDPKHDRFIFDMLEDEKGRESSSSTWTSVKIQCQLAVEELCDTNTRETDLFIPRSNKLRELKVYNRGVERIVTPNFIDNLGDGLLEASNNTVLHLVSKIGNVACIEYILGKDPSLITCRNCDMETPAYVAAREGRVDILRFLIMFAKQKNEDIELCYTRSIDKHNALHIAIQNHHVEVVFLLIEEIPQLANQVSESKESPLYLAAERRYFGFVELMLNKCQEEIAFDGPNGRTALHAAAISNSPECLEHLLNRKPDLLNVQDKQCWTPLHHAVYHNSLLAAKKLLDMDYSIGYQLFLECGIYTSAIHIAASRGHCETMEVLMDMCPGCSDFIDNQGRNILHMAVENKKNEAIEFIFRDKSLTNLINQKDKNGNTPVHLLVASEFEKMEILIDSRVNMNTLNNEKLTPMDMTSSDDQRERLIKAITMGTSIHDRTSTMPPKINKRGADEVERKTKSKKTDRHFVIVDNLVVVAALIATASFAAAFTMPGGYDSNDGSKKGTPFLLKKPAFQAFIVTNAVAFTSSCSVLLGHIALVFYRNRYDEASLDEQEYIDGKIEDMYYLTTLALFAMTIAFVTGVYVVLTPSLGLAISVCAMSILLTAINIHKDSFARTRKKADDSNIPSFPGRPPCR